MRSSSKDDLRVNVTLGTQTHKLKFKTRQNLSSTTHELTRDWCATRHIADLLIYWARWPGFLGKPAGHPLFGPTRFAALYPWFHPIQPNPTQPNPTQPNPTQPKPIQPNPTRCVVSCRVASCRRRRFPQHSNSRPGREFECCCPAGPDARARGARAARPGQNCAPGAQFC